jgi:squalene-associated FAD-dependent desaturase
MGRAIVVGAGLAGLKAALELQAEGLEVLVLEARSRVGGRAFSFADPTDGTMLDNGQHVILGCCTAFRHLLDEMDLHDAVLLPPTLQVPIYKNGTWSTLGSIPAAGPLHLAVGMLKYRHLPLRGRLAALKAATRFSRPAEAGSQSFFHWLQAQGQRPAEIESLWNLLTVSVFNADARDLDAGAAIRGFRFGFQGGPGNAALGLFQRPLGDVPAAAAARLVSLGAQVRLGTRVNGLRFERGHIQGVTLASGEQIPADVVVAAVPPARLAHLLEELPDAQELQDALRRFPVNPILNVYLRFSHPVMEETAVAAVSGPVQFVFNRGALLGQDADLIALSLSAAGEWVGRSRDEIMSRLLPELHAILPGTRTASLKHVRLVWQHDATVVLTPATAGLRLPPQTPWAGLTLAGDWTATDWPCSMESAVRSGTAAARAALA